eukprot:2723550-Pyramimonas_sp.AAC.1
MFGIASSRWRSWGFSSVPEGVSMRLPSPLSVSILGIGIGSRLVIGPGRASSLAGRCRAELSPGRVELIEGSVGVTPTY